jgi:hypothetical protein
MAENGVPKKRVEYVPPAPEVIDQVARDICRELAASDPAFNQPDVVYGLASFLSAVARIHARHLNRLKCRAEAASLDSE